MLSIIEDLHRHACRHLHTAFLDHKPQAPILQAVVSDLRLRIASLQPFLDPVDLRRTESIVQKPQAFDEVLAGMHMHALDPFLMRQGAVLTAQHEHEALLRIIIQHRMGVKRGFMTAWAMKRKIFLAAQLFLHRSAEGSDHIRFLFQKCRISACRTAHIDQSAFQRRLDRSGGMLEPCLLFIVQIR